MSIANGKINTPVSFEDVRKVVGTTEQNLNELCTNDKINMWAKWKPVRFTEKDTTSYMTNGAWKEDSLFSGQSDNPAWWWGDYNYGINFSNAAINVSTANTEMFTRLGQLASLIDGKGNGWVYEKPRGVNGIIPNTSRQRNEWFRIDDFKQYNHMASTPVKSARLSTDNIQTSSSGLWELSVSLKVADDDGSIDNRDFVFPWDVVSLSLNLNTRAQRYQMYLGMAIYKINGNDKEAIGWVTGDTDGDAMKFEGVGILNRDAASTADFSYDDYVAIMKLRNGSNYAVLPFLCNKALPQPTDENGNVRKGYSVQPGQCTIYTCPNVNFLYFTATQTATTQMIGYPTVSNRDISPSNKYTATVYIDARDTSYYQGGTIQAGQFQVLVVNDKYTYYGQGRTQENCAYEYNSTSAITVQRGEYHEVFTITNLALDANQNWRVVMNISGQYTSIALRQHPIFIEPTNE